MGAGQRSTSLPSITTAAQNPLAADTLVFALKINTSGAHGRRFPFTSRKGAFRH